MTKGINESRDEEERKGRRHSWSKWPSKSEEFNPSTALLDKLLNPPGPILLIGKTETILVSLGML